jgi:hypothetical protein
VKKPKLAFMNPDKRIAELAGKYSQRILAIWAADCAERVLPYFERIYPQDERPRKAIKACRDWTRGNMKVSEARTAALASHAAARVATALDTADSSAQAIETSVAVASAVAAARAAAHAAAAAHVAGHAIVAAAYAVKVITYAVNLTDSSNSAADINAVDTIVEEYDWQYIHLLNLGQD